MNLREIRRYLEKNGPGIATAVSMVLTGLSVYFAIRKSAEGAAVIEEYETMVDNLNDVPIADRKDTDRLALNLNAAKALAGVYKESLACAAGAITLTYLANRLNGQKIAGLAAALALNEDKLRKVYSKAEKVFGAGAADNLKETIDDIPFDEEPDLAKRRHRREETCLFYESYTDSLFESNIRDVNDAITRAKHRIDQDPRHTLNFNKWRSLLGLEDAPCGVCVGWHRNHLPFEVIQKVMYIDGKEVVGLYYENDPESSYDNWNRY